MFPSISRLFLRLRMAKVYSQTRWWPVAEFASMVPPLPTYSIKRHIINDVAAISVSVIMSQLIQITHKLCIRYPGNEMCAFTCRIWPYYTKDRLGQSRNYDVCHIWHTADAINHGTTRRVYGENVSIPL